MTPDRALLLYLADLAEEALIRSGDPYAPLPLRELDRLRKPLLDAEREEAEVRKLIGMPAACCGNPRDCSRLDCWVRR